MAGTGPRLGQRSDVSGTVTGRSTEMSMLTVTFTLADSAGYGQGCVSVNPNSSIHLLGTGTQVFFGLTPHLPTLPLTSPVLQSTVRSQPGSQGAQSPQRAQSSNCHVVLGELISPITEK